MTIFEVYKDSLKKLQNPEIEEINIRILLCEINSLKTMSDFFVHKDEEIRDLQEFNKLFDRFLSGEPIQYILEKTTFLGLDFFVDKRVLIPRQESEEVVDFAIRKIKSVFGSKKLDVVDVCCGSGIMGICLAKSLPTNHLYLTDISEDAIEVSKINSKNIEVNALTFVGDALEPIVNENIKCDVLISNPPYILKNEKVEESVLDYEPHQALFTDEDFSIYKKIISSLRSIKKEKLIAFFEIGENTRKVIEPFLIKEFPDYEYEFVKDMNKKERILYIFVE